MKNSLKNTQFQVKLIINPSFIIKICGFSSMGTFHSWIPTYFHTTILILSMIKLGSSGLWFQIYYYDMNYIYIIKYTWIIFNLHDLHEISHVCHDTYGNYEQVTFMIQIIFYSMIMYEFTSFSWFWIWWLWAHVIPLYFITWSCFCMYKIFKYCFNRDLGPLRWPKIPMGELGS